MSSWYTAAPRILVADDDHDLLNLIAFAFRTFGYATVSVSDGQSALTAIQRESFSVLVLDINMPAPNGLEVCATVRQTSSVPVMMLSARDREEDLLQALDAGADAYLTKPFSPRVLAARVQALFRRAANAETRVLQSPNFRLDLNELQLIHRTSAIPLTRLEIRVLRLLMANAGRSITANELSQEVWNGFGTANRNTLKQAIFRLRRKLAATPLIFDALKTTPTGYMWSEATTAVVGAVTPSSHSDASPIDGRVEVSPISPTRTVAQGLSQ